MAINLVSKAFSPEKSKNYRLSIREYSDGFSFCVLDDASQRCVAAVACDTNSVTEFLRHEFLQYRYRCVEIITAEAAHVVVPTLLYDAQKAVQYLPLNEQQQKRALVDIVDYEHLGLVSISNHRGSIEFTNSDATTYIHPLAAMMRQVGMVLRRTFFVDLQNDCLYLLVLEHDKLLLANSAEIHGLNDAIYFILLAFQQLSMDVEQVPVVIGGRVDDALLAQLQRYVRHVRFVSPQSGSMWSSEFDGRYFPQFSLQV